MPCFGLLPAVGDVGLVGVVGSPEAVGRFEYSPWE